jgi:hypothetical protein
MGDAELFAVIAERVDLLLRDRSAMGMLRSVVGTL